MPAYDEVDPLAGQARRLAALSGFRVRIHSWRSPRGVWHYYALMQFDRPLRRRIRKG